MSDPQKEMVLVPVWTVNLAIGFLEKYGERLGNDGCNDYTLPDWVPVDSLKEWMPHWSNQPDMSEDEKNSLLGYNHAVVGVTKYVLKDALGF